MNARASIQHLAREAAMIDPDRETCRECDGSGRGDYGRCPDCDGIGSHPAETTHLHDKAYARLLAELRAGYSMQNIGSCAPAGDASATPLNTPAGASNSHASRKAA